MAHDPLEYLQSVLHRSTSYTYRMPFKIGESIANADGRAAELVRILRANMIDQCELRNAVGIMRERGALTEARAIADQHQDACLRIISNMDFLRSEDSELWCSFIPYFSKRDRWKEASP